ncbi:hypothetical protein JTE90_021325 [Oedothorax gibbosus]|uniref:Mucolipin extracytosolic domain-containing protein n=1 Tax=Oedothorax gibbosus TaxID=931172 RepID=A0AAV6VLI9_9ARAC|nr:hypothetical protein JTE90_021325 [Oedothorax gibbosus]
MDSIRASYQGDKKGLFLHVKMPANISNEGTPLLGEKHFLDEAEIIPPDFVYKKQQESRRMHALLTGFFMNPIEKWRIRRLFPWKLCLQICILVLGAFQMYSFGEQRSHHLRRNAETSTTLSKMFLKDWAPEEAANPYVDRQHAVYTAPDFFAHVDFTMNQFIRLHSITTGPYGYDSRNGRISLPTICLRAHDGHVYPETSIIEINGPPRETCLDIAVPDANEAFSIVDFLQKSNMTLDFGIFIAAETNMRLRSVSTMSTDIVPECHLLNVTTTYDNSDHNGLLAIAMRIASTRIDCQIKRKFIDNPDDRLDDSLGKKLMDVSLLVLCVFSVSLCARSFFRGWRLGCEAARYFKLYHGQRMSMGERVDFVDLWYVAIVGGAVLAAAGSLLQSRPLEEEGDFAACSVLLGVGYLLVLMGTLRYLKLFPTYNLLLLTLKKATPNVLRFLFAVLLLFAGIATYQACILSRVGCAALPPSPAERRPIVFAALTREVGRSPPSTLTRTAICGRALYLTPSRSIYCRTLLSHHHEPSRGEARGASGHHGREVLSHSPRGPRRRLRWQLDRGRLRARIYQKVFDLGQMGQTLTENRRFFNA